MRKARKVSKTRKGRKTRKPREEKEKRKEIKKRKNGNFLLFFAVFLSIKTKSVESKKIFLKNNSSKLKWGGRIEK